MSEEHCETSGKKETESGYILEIEPTGGRGEIPFTEMGGKNRRKIKSLLTLKTQGKPQKDV